MAQPATIDEDGAPFWDGLAAGELRYQSCRSCGRAIFYPRNVCPHCLSQQLDWSVSAGHGEVYAFTVVHRVPNQAFGARVPYVAALVDLDEGFRMMTNVVGCDSDDVRVGMKVSLVFGEGVDGQPLPYFQPASH